MEWDVEDDPSLSCTVLCYGAPKVGKTDWALRNFPEPVYVADTEGRVELVAQKLKKLGRQVYRKRVFTLDNIKAVVKAAIAESSADKHPGTFVFDSASDLQHYAEDAFLKETNKDKIYPRVVWARVFEKIDELIDALRKRGFTVVFLAREKDEYSGENKTGVGFEGYKKLPFKSDLVVRHRQDKLQIVASGLARTFPKHVSTGLTWSELWDILSDDNKVAAYVAATTKKE